MSARELLSPRFVSLDEAVAWHEIGIVQYGGSFGIRDQGALEAALAMPRQAFGGEFAHAFPFEMAAAYAFHLAKNHPFVDGNKRIALMCCGAFLRMNGWNLVSSGVVAADQILALVEGKMDKTEFADWLSRTCIARPSIELRDFFASLTAEHLEKWASPAIDVTQTREQFAASGAEAMLHIPLIRQLQTAKVEADAAGQSELGHGHHGVVVFLTAIYRIAEDMGYEW